MTDRKHIADQITAYLSGDLGPDERAAIENHLADCPACRNEFQALANVWNAAGGLPEEYPSERLKSRFYAALDAYESALRGAENVQSSVRPKWFGSLLHPKPAVRFALAGALLIAVFAAGYQLHAPAVDESEIAQLRDEVRTVNHLLTVSLLRQQSASERLQGVNRSSRMEKTDPEITAALLQTFQHDPNVNVRLAALDALAHDLGQKEIRQELLSALQTQSSPMVQIAIIDLMVQAGEKQSAGVMKQMLQKGDVNKVVRKRIEDGLVQLNS